MTATSPVPCDKARLARRGASWYKRLPNVTYTGWIRVVPLRSIRMSWGQDAIARSDEFVALHGLHLSKRFVIRAHQLVLSTIC